MSISTQYSKDNDTLRIHIRGRFDFHVHREFRKAYDNLQEIPAKFVIDLDGTEYMDSSALGMLLLLRERVGPDMCNIDIINANDVVKEILKISNFNQLFNIN